MDIIDPKYIPLDKSWINRMGILDIVNGYDDIEKFLAKEESLGDDLLALKRAALNWRTDAPIDVGESGTLYRLLKFASWKLGLNKKFITRGTLPERPITDDPKIINLSQSELLKLDQRTSQWASAAVLLGDTKRLADAPFKLKLAYEAVEYWNKQREEGKTWEPRYDQTILKQAEAYLKLLTGERADFVPEQSEDFCFAYAFGYVGAEEGNKRWPNLKGNETDRTVEMERVMKDAREGREININDHRAVQAAAMWGKVNHVEVRFSHPEAVNKSWPQFWDFLKSYE